MLTKPTLISHLNISITLASKHGLDVAVVIAAYVDWCTWSAKNAYLQAHGRYWTRKTPAGLSKIITSLSKQRINRAISTALQEGLLVKTTHSVEGFVVFALGEEIIRDLPNDIRLVHIEKFLNWKVDEDKKEMSLEEKVKIYRATPTIVPKMGHNSLN